jgi:hypothetical protein
MMIWGEVALAGVALALAATNALTTRRLWSSPAFERSQKIAQTAPLWLLPGTFLVVRHVLAEPHRPTRDADPTIGHGTFHADESESHHHGGNHDPP